MRIEWLPQHIGREKIFGLDAFRGIAALLVFLFHFWTIFLLNAPVTIGNFSFTPLFAAGHLGVDIFFVISGFLITLSLLTSSSLRSYFRKRLLRLIPLAWFFSAAIFFVQGNFSGTEWWNFLAHITFLQGFFSDTYHGLNPVMWTLSVEAIFYLLLPFLFYLGRKKWWHFWGILLLLLILNFWYRFWLMQFFPEWDQLTRVFYSEQLWGRFDQFVFGIALAQLWIFRAQVARFVQKLYSILMILGIGLLGFGMKIFSDLGGAFRETVWGQVFLHSLVGLGFALFLGGFLFAPHIIQRFFAPRWLLFTGLISYSVYLWHFPILSKVFEYLENPWLAFVIALWATIVFSTLSFWLIEKPFLKKKAGGIAF